MALCQIYPEEEDKLLLHQTSHILPTLRDKGIETIMTRAQGTSTGPGKADTAVELRQARVVR